MSPHCCRCSFICTRLNKSELKKPTNETLLCVAFISFMSFASIQIIVALIAKSEAMLGDSAAMVVDACTYGFNLYAERKKNEEDDELTESEDASEIELATNPGDDRMNSRTRQLAERLKLERHYESRRRHLHLELLPPLISVSFLLVVIGLVLHNAIQTLILDAHRSEKEQSIPSLILMMTFSVLNLVLDLINVTCFARAKHLMGYNTDENKKNKKTGQKYDVIAVDSNDSEGLIEEHETQYEIHEPIPEGNGVGHSNGNGLSNNGIVVIEEDDEGEVDEDDRVNLNMCSAYTHVFADTLRSIAVIIAAGIAEMVDSVTPEVADATAAVIVSVIIFISVLPLFRGIFHTWCELRSITREEQSSLDNLQNAVEEEIRIV